MLIARLNAVSWLIFHSVNVVRPSVESLALFFDVGGPVIDAGYPCLVPRDVVQDCLNDVGEGTEFT
jgi:hypothetical protein